MLVTKTNAPSLLTVTPCAPAPVRMVLTTVPLATSGTALGRAHECACAQAVAIALGGRSRAGTSPGDDTKDGATAAGWAPQAVTNN